MQRNEIYDDFKLKKTSCLHGLYRNISCCKGLIFLHFALFQARLLMFYCSRITLGNGLRIIGIEALKEM